MYPYDVEMKVIDGLPVVFVKGYCGQEAGQKLVATVDKVLRNGDIKMVIDFSECRLINSPGSVGVMDATLKIVDDFKGKVCVTGLDDIKIQVFKMVGVFPLAEVTGSFKDGIALIKK